MVSDNQIWAFNRTKHMKQFLENHTENVVEKLVPDPFLKIEIEHISESIVQSFIYFAFIVCPI